VGGVMELNPDHPVTAQLHDQWHKLAEILLHKLGGYARITTEDITAIGALYPGDRPTVLTYSKKDGIHLTLMPESLAAKKCQQ